ncbi:hypothetical protein B296_00026594 [Ensete ventricosum]|uniref:HD domain-containing protein n=1 Tax=Ensete ventricosum TaxID=4639 RepID=A0A426XMK4_ENSVE|nr:hypothetical protein B296_00026594 [Ensete ventricosum]
MEAEKGKPEIVWKAEKLVAATMGGRDASHDAAHAFRVRGLALSLAKEEALSGPSLEIVRIYPPILFSYFFVLQQFHPVRKRYDDGALSTKLVPNLFALVVRNYDLLVFDQVELAALLHDIGDYKYAKWVLLLLPHV